MDNRNRRDKKQRKIGLTSLTAQSVDSQARVAIVLLSLIPALSCFYIGAMLSSEGGRALPLFALIVVLICTAIVAVSGYLVLRKYSKNIVRLRQYVEEIAAGTRPDSIQLFKAESSDDLRCIENGLNIILRGIEERVKLVEEKLSIESDLRRALEKQQQVLLNTERHRVMLQSIGAACHHLGQPATVLRMRLYLMKERVRTTEEMREIDDSLKDVDAIELILTKLREVNEYRTEPYLHDGDSDDNQILAI